MDDKKPDLFASDARMYDINDFIVGKDKFRCPHCNQTFHMYPPTDSEDSTNYDLTKDNFIQHLKPEIFKQFGANPYANTYYTQTDEKAERLYNQWMDWVDRIYQLYYHLRTPQQQAEMDAIRKILLKPHTGLYVRDVNT